MGRVAPKLSNLFARPPAARQAADGRLPAPTVLGVLGYPLREPELLRRLLALLEQGTASYRHLAFALLLVFPYPETIDYLSDKLRLERLTTDDLCELLDRMRLDNEPGRVYF